jgi:hypothetical protein
MGKERGGMGEGNEEGAYQNPGSLAIGVKSYARQPSMQYVFTEKEPHQHIIID